MLDIVTVTLAALWMAPPSTVALFPLNTQFAKATIVSSERISPLRMAPPKSDRLPRNLQFVRIGFAPKALKMAPPLTPPRFATNVHRLKTTSAPQLLIPPPVLAALFSNQHRSKTGRPPAIHAPAPSEALLARKEQSIRTGSPPSSKSGPPPWRGLGNWSERARPSSEPRFALPRPPPFCVAVLFTNEQSRTVGSPSSIYIPPPIAAKLPLNVQLETVIRPPSMYIPPPVKTSHVSSPV